MAEKTTKKAKAPAAKKSTKKAATPAARAGAEKSAVPMQRAAVSSAAELSEEVLTSVEAGQRAAIEAVRRFVETVDEVVPTIGDRPSRREKVIDAALDMADKLVTTQYDFLRNVVREAARTLGEPGSTKEE
jgi:hypothetical protein